MSNISFNQQLYYENPDENLSQKSYTDLFEMLMNETESNESKKSMNQLNRELQRINADKINEIVSLFDKENLSIFKLKENSEFRQSQNENTKSTFIERYLFLIMKILFFVVLIFYLLYRIRPSLVTTESLKDIRDKMIDIKKSTTNTFQNIKSSNKNTL